MPLNNDSLPDGVSNESPYTKSNRSPLFLHSTVNYPSLSVGNRTHKIKWRFLAQPSEAKCCKTQNILKMYKPFTNTWTHVATVDEQIYAHAVDHLKFVAKSFFVSKSYAKQIKSILHACHSCSRELLCLNSFLDEGCGLFQKK